LIPRGFTQVTDEMTPTLKVRRNVVIKNFAAEIQAMYEE
jgi:long-subunit acyl-CoA synthetase (AMP-forming)